MSALGHDVAQWMASMAVQVTLLCAFVWAIDVLVARRTWPGLRYALWCLVPLKLVLPPDVASPVSVSAPAVGAAQPITDAAAAAVATSSSVPWTTLALFAWVTGVLVFGVRHALRRHRVVRALRQGVHTPAHVINALQLASQRVGLRRAPRVVLHANAPGPAVFGLLRPVVLLPVRYANPSTQDELDHVLLHECAHVRRGDLWMQALFALVNLVYWFHPLVFVARHRAHALRELCCDLTVARHLGGDTPAYRRTLIEAAGRTLLRPAGGAGFLPFRRSTILDRIRALEVESWRKPGWRRLGAAALVVILAVTVLPMAEQAATTLVPAPSLEQELDDARTVLAKTLNEKPRYGCFHRQAAFFRVVQLEDELDAERVDASR